MDPEGKKRGGPLEPPKLIMFKLGDDAACAAICKFGGGFHHDETPSDF
jgi:hypothetical protein